MKHRLWALAFVTVNLFAVASANAATFNAVADGGWSTVATWNCTDSCGGEDGIPDADDTVTIPTSRVVTISGAESIHILNVDAGGSLTLNGGGTLTTDGTAGSAIFGAGNIGGAGIVRTQGTTSVTFVATFTSPWQIISGTTIGQGSLGGSMTVAAGATLDTTDQAFTITGDLINNGTITKVSNNFRSDGSTLTNNGTITGGNFVFGRSGNQFLSGTGAIAAIGSITNSTTVSLTSNHQLLALAVNSGGTLLTEAFILSLNGAGTPLSGAGSMVNVSVNYNGTTAQTVQTTDVTYNHLGIDNAAGVTLSADESVNSRLTLTNGTFNNAGFLTMNNDATIVRANGSLATAPTFAGVINIIYFGSNPITTGLEIPPSNTIINLTNNNTSTVTLSDSLTINGNATLIAGSTLAGAGGTALNFNGSLFTNSGTESVPTTTFSGGSQTISGNGAWTGGVFQLTGASNTSLASNVTFSNSSLTVSGGTSLVTGGNLLTFNGTTFTNSGTVSGAIRTTGTNVSLNAGASGFNASLNVNSGTTTAQGSTSGSVTVDVSATGLQISPGQFTIGGNLTANAPIGGSGTLRFNGSTFTNNAAVSTASVQFGGTTQSLSGSGGLSGNSATVLSGSITTLGANKQMSTVSINAGGTFNISNRTLLLSGAGTPLTVNGTFSVTGSTVEYNGTAAQVLAAFTPYYNLSLNNTTGVTEFAGLTVSQLLRVRAGTFTSSNSFKNVQIDSGATLAGVNATTINISGNWITNGTFTANGNTVNFNGVSAQIIGGSALPARFNNLTINNATGVSLSGNLAVNGALTLTAGTLAIGSNQLTLNGAVSATGGTLSSAVNSIVWYSGSSSQAVLAANYGNLYFLNSPKILPVGTVGVAGEFIFATATGHTITGSTINFNSAGGQNIPAFNYYNLTSSGTGDRGLAVFGTIGVAGTFTPGTNTYLGGTDSTVSFNGAGAQTIPAFTFYNLSTATSGTKTLGGAVSANGGLTIGSGTTLDVSASNFALNVRGNWTNNGTFTPQSGTVTFNGSAAQTAAGTTATNFNNLTIANAGSGVSLAVNAAVNGLLTLTNDLNTGANTLTMPASGTSAGSGDVIGNVTRTGFSGGGAALSFGNPFNRIAFGAGGTLPTSVNVNLAKLQPAGLANAVRRSYSITQNGGTGFSSAVRLHYLDGELNGNTESTLKLFRFGAVWSDLGAAARDSSDNWVEQTGITQFSPWAISSIALPGISGTITYGNAIGTPAPRFVSNVTITGAGSPTVISTTAAPGANAGQYALSGFGAGSYTITPTKTGGANGITSFDAARIAQHVAGINVLTGTQFTVADVSGNGTLSSFDAGQVARYVAGVSGSGLTASWIFSPPNRIYSDVTTSITGQDYSALLMGEVSGNWTNTGARPFDGGYEPPRQPKRLPPLLNQGGEHLIVELPTVVVSVDKEIVVPVNVDGIADKGVISNEFDLRYDPSVVQPQIDPVSVTGTASRGLSFVTNAQEPGLLRVVMYGAFPIDGPQAVDGVLLNLRFVAVGQSGSVSPISFERIMFNEGDALVSVANGLVQIVGN
ncbi:MAG: hypothetical protein IPL32_15860 [Chloracidobacterium sp.]|nr:hypothetical protein [Chloracidobacterium sp.]